MKAVNDIKDIDTAIRNGANTLAEVKTAIIQNASLVAEINKELGIAEEIVVAEETVVEPEQTSDGGVFSARLEALISAALQDGVLTEQEKVILKKRVEKEGEDWDEVEMIVEARLAEMKPTATVTQVSQTQVQPEVMSSGQESPYLIVNGKEYKDASIDEIDQFTLTNVAGLNESDIVSVIIPNSVKRIKRYAFCDCKRLKELVIPSSVERIEKNAFGISKEEFSYEKLQINCPIIPECAFNGATLKEVILGENVKEIGASAFANCDKLSKLSLPKSLIKIGDYAFECSNIQIVDMSQCNSLEIIGEWAFSGCSSAEFVFPEEFKSLKCIWYYAFKECKKITSFPFSKALKMIRDDAFYGCSNLQILDFSKCIELRNIDYDIIYKAGLDSLKKIILPPSQTAFNALCVWTPNVHIGKTTNQVEVDMSHCNFKEVWGNAFGTMDMKEIVIPDTVETIGEKAFDECKNLKTIVMPAALKEIQAPLGSKMEELRRIDFSKVRHLEIIPKDFIGYGCYKLKELMIPIGVKKIERHIGGDKLQKLFLPPTIKEVEDLHQVNLDIYCYAPMIEELGMMVESIEKPQKACHLYVLPEYLDSYKGQLKAEGVSENILSIDVIPEEYRYYYDN